jgi:HEAT repeat protein
MTGDMSVIEPTLTPAELRRALFSSDPRERAAALRRARPDPAAEPAVLVALHDDHAEVRLAATGTLARLPGPRAARALIEASALDPSPQVRLAAVGALASLLEARVRQATDPEDKAQA